VEDDIVVRRRSNPLALAVLMCLYERPMHPYEVAATLRQRHKDESVRLNYGSLYAVVGSLERRGLIEAQEVEREGRLPERTVYRITESGRVEAHDWLADLIVRPVKEYPAFEAGLSFLPALPPDEARALLEERLLALDVALGEWRGVRELLERRGLPRLFWVEGEYAARCREAERDYVAELIADIASGELGGSEWWEAIHVGDGADIPPPGFPWLEGAGAEESDEQEQS
jgi:DNA-binding PadR family transcriptional regulator